MPAALVDSNVLIAAASKRDERHQMGRSIVASADGGDLPILRIPNYVLAETLNFITERAGQSAALEFYDRLCESVGFEFVRTTKQDDQAAIDQLRRSEHLSFVDAVTVVYARRRDLGYCYSFDDFDRVDGLSRIEAVLDPFAPD